MDREVLAGENAYLEQMISVIKKWFLPIAVLACAVCAQAEVLTLRTGAIVVGTIVFENEEVVVLKDASGARYQYPREDVLSVGQETQTNDTQQDIATLNAAAATKRVSVAVELAGGAAFIPTDTTGGYFGANLLVGSYDMLGKRIFLGIGVGYSGEFCGGQKYAFLPIQLVAHIPLLQQKHAPMVGLSLGYGVALSKDYQGGLYTGANIGYCYRLSAKSALYIAADVQWQQAKIDVKETIEGTTFTNYTGRSILHAGVRLGLFF